jgi:hypothetical protein
MKELGDIDRVNVNEAVLDVLGEEVTETVRDFDGDSVDDDAAVTVGVSDVDALTDDEPVVRVREEFARSNVGVSFRVEEIEPVSVVTVDVSVGVHV